MKAFALVTGPRRKVLYVSDSVQMLYTLGAETFQPQMAYRFPREERKICKDNGAYVIRVEYTLGDPITTPRKKAEKQAA